MERAANTPEVIRGALKTPQLQRLLENVFATPFPALLFRLDKTNIARSVADVINTRLGEKKLTYYDVVGIKDYAKRILSESHQAGALISFDIPLRLAGGIILMPGDIAIYKDIRQDIVGLSAPRSSHPLQATQPESRILRYYHVSDLPSVPPEIMATITRSMAPQEVVNLCSSASTFNFQLCRNASTLEFLWRMNISERESLADIAILALPSEKRVDAMLNRYLDALKIIEEAIETPNKVYKLSKLGYEKALAKFQKQNRYGTALSGAAEGGKLALFKDLVAMEPLGPDDVYSTSTVVLRSGNVEVLKFLESVAELIYDAYSLVEATRGTLEMYKYIENKLGLDKLRDDPKSYQDRVGRDNMRLIFEGAARSGNIELLKYVWEVIANTPMSTKLSSVLSQVVSKGDLHTLEFMGANVPSSEEEYEHVINDAIQSGNIDVLKYVLSRAGDPKFILKEGKTNNDYLIVYPYRYNSVLYAIRHGRLDMVKFLLAASGLPLKSAINSAYVRAFRNAAVSGSVEMFRYLIGAGLDHKKLKQTDIDGMLFDAAGNGRADMVKYLMSIYTYMQDELRKIARLSGPSIRKLLVPA